MNETVVVTSGVRRGPLRRLRGRTVRGGRELKEEFLRQRGTRRPHVWVARRAGVFALLADAASVPRGDLRLLLLDENLSAAQREFLGALFRCVLTANGTVRLLGEHELVDVLNSEHRRDLFIGAAQDSESRAVVLYRGNLDRLIVPGEWFTSKPARTRPNVSAVAITDSGQTVRLGRFEASADAILYELDSGYRRRAKLRSLRLDRSFGGSLRRLRLQKGLSRNDFPGVSAREIARIEGGKVRKPHLTTVEAISKRLGVAPEAIATY